MKADDLPFGMSVQPTKILGSCCYVVAKKTPHNKVEFLICNKTRMWGGLYDCKTFAKEIDAHNFLYPMWAGFGHDWHYIVEDRRNPYMFNVQFRNLYLDELYYLQDGQRFTYIDNPRVGELKEDEDYEMHTNWSSEQKRAYQFVIPSEAQRVMFEIITRENTT